MAVRNITSIGATKPIPIYTWIPPSFSPIYKIEIETSLGNYDVTDFVLEGSYKDGITETIGSFEIKIDNSTQEYSNKFSLYDKVKIYLDYGATATTLRFTGMIEKIPKTESNIVIYGRGSAARVTGKNITYSATEKSRSTILSEIINKYFSGVITTNNIETDSGKSTVNYFERPFWEVVEELCKTSDYDAYIDADFDFHYFPRNSRLNTTEAIVHEYNLINTGEFSQDLERVYNRIRVYGARFGGIPLIATAEDTNSQADLDGDIKELKINDSNIITRQQVKDRADYELARQKDPPTIGTVTSLMLPTIAPGEKVRISDPLNGLTPGEYLVHTFTHNFSNDEPPKTDIEIQKEKLSIPHILKSRIKFETEISENDNPNEMEESIIFNFENDTGEHSNTLIDTNKGLLKTDGVSSGNWISELYILDKNVSNIEPRVEGEDLSNVEVYVSLNGGTNYIPTSFTGSREITTGKDLKIKVELRSEDAQVKTIGLLYK